MNETAATASRLVDDLDVDRDNWLQLAFGHQTLTVRNFFYDWDIEPPAAQSIERAMPQASGFARRWA
jgi:hypothetical protein